MNKIVEQIQQDYRKKRELSNHSIYDIEGSLKELAEKGIIWVLKDLGDICEAEEILIEKYLHVYRTNQIYDNLEENFYIQTSNEQSTVYPHQMFSNQLKQGNKTKKKQPNYLEVKDVKKFIGYQKAKELEENIIELCKSLPSYEREHIVDQIGRSAKSIKERIAMGEQIYVGEKFNQYSISIGSAKETAAWLQISFGQKYITQKQYNDMDNLVNQVVSILTKTLCHLRNRNNEGKGMELPSPYTPNVKHFGGYEKALLLVEKIYEITRQREFWQEKDLLYGMRRCATCCVANLAEAHQLYIPKKFKFFNEALKALNGLESKLETALTKGIISGDSFNEITHLKESIRNILLKRLGNISKDKAV